MRCFLISKEEILSQINMCKEQIVDLEENLKKLDLEAEKLKDIQHETHKRISFIKKEITGLKSHLIALEKKDSLARKQLL